MKENNVKEKVVAIKVLHPNIKQKIDSDLKIMSFFVELLYFIPSMQFLSFREIIQQFSVSMNKQLDMKIEAQNLHKFNQNFDRSQGIIIPLPIIYDHNVLGK